MRTDLNTNERLLDMFTLPARAHKVQFPNSVQLGRSIVNIEVEQFEIDRLEQERLEKLRPLQPGD